MRLPEELMAENLDQIIRRCVLRLEQESAHVGMLQEGGAQYIAAKVALELGTAALGRLRIYRSNFD